MTIERTLVLLKPDAVRRTVMGQIITRFENAGLKIIGMKMMQMTQEFSKKHYSAHIDKPFYKPLEKFMTSSPLVAVCIEGVDAVDNVRKLVGNLEPKTSAPGTIRGDFAHISKTYSDAKGTGIRNLVHASGSSAEAKTEVKLWFKEEELMKYKRCDEEDVL